MNIRHPVSLALSAALAASLGLTGCQGETDDELDAPPVAEAPVGTLEPDATGTPEMPGDAAGPLEGMDPGLDDGIGDDTGPTALDITSVALGSEAGPDDTIAMPTDTFAADDDIVVAIDTDGAASNAELEARLVYQDGQIAGEQSETITTTGADTTVVTFDNAETWPAGDYTLEVWVDGTRAETAELTVE